MQRAQRCPAPLCNLESIACTPYDFARFHVGDDLRHVVIVGEHVPDFLGGRLHRKLDIDGNHCPMLLNAYGQIAVGRRGGMSKGLCHEYGHHAEEFGRCRQNM